VIKKEGEWEGRTPNMPAILFSRPSIRLKPQRKATRQLNPNGTRSKKARRRTRKKMLTVIDVTRECPYEGSEVEEEVRLDAVAG